MKQWEQAHMLVFGQKPRSLLFPTGKSSGIILEESRLIMGSALISDSVNESLQQSFGEMKEVLQSKPVAESNYSTDVGKFTVQVCKEIINEMKK